MKVLIAEDDYFNRWVLAEMMSTYGKCIETANGKDAVDTFYWAHKNNRPYELVLLDIMMPEMDGFSALEKIRHFEKSHNIPDSQKTKIVMLTALKDPANVDRALNEGGADSYLVKPIQMKSLRQVLTELGFAIDDQLHVPQKVL
ncbi:MAG: response regulator [Desulfonatronovibrio sp.]